MRSARCLDQRSGSWCGWRRAAIAMAFALWQAPASGAPVADDEALVDMVSRPGGAGVGMLISSERSPYRGEGFRRDVLPVYLYEGERVFLRTDRLGLKFAPAAGQELDVYLRRRFAGFPLDETPTALQGLPMRHGGADLGATWRLHAGAARLHASAALSLAGEPRGQEVSLGAYGDWLLGPVTLRPAATATWRSSGLNDHYFGVPPELATPSRPAYEAGAGVDFFVGLYASYPLTDGWRLFAGAGATRYSAAVRASPIVEGGTHPGVTLGATYNLQANTVRAAVAESPTILRVLVGVAAVDKCNIVLITTLQCTTINSTTPTEIAGVTVGKMLVKGLNDWPFDVAGFLGVIYHRDRPYQRDGAELNLFLKGVFRGFPWSDRVLTRAGFGWGISISDPVPYAEVAEQASRGRLTSRILNYVEPSIDISIGDVIGQPAWKETFLGLSVTHRSGIFGTSRLLGNVDGGSNYVTLYVEFSI